MPKLTCIYYEWCLFQGCQSGCEELPNGLCLCTGAELLYLAEAVPSCNRQNSRIAPDRYIQGILNHTATAEQGNYWVSSSYLEESYNCRTVNANSVVAGTECSDKTNAVLCVQIGDTISSDSVSLCCKV